MKRPFLHPDVPWISIKKLKVFAAMVLIEDVSMVFFGLFGFRSGRDVNKFERVNFKIGNTGSPN